MARDEVPAEVLEIAARAAEGAGPSRVILFGSHARGEARPDSDLDLLLLLPDDANLFEAAVRAQGPFWPRHRALDLVPMRRSHFEWGASVLAREAAREGVVVFG